MFYLIFDIFTAVNRNVIIIIILMKMNNLLVILSK
jgi:hypothetical protein